MTGDRIERVTLSSITLPLDAAISDAKVLTGRQRPRPSTSRSGTSRPHAPACRWPRCSAPTATRWRCYDTSGGFLHEPVEQIVENAGRNLAAGIGGIKINVGHPTPAVDLVRARRVREALDDDVPLMVDANQQWDRPTARRVCRALDEFGLVWIEEPLDA